MTAKVQALPTKCISIDLLFKAFAKYGASDLHLRQNRPPLFRVDGRVLASSLPDLSPSELEELLLPLVPKFLESSFQINKNIDFTLEKEEFGRFRFNLFYSMGSLSASVRRIPFEIPSLSSLGVPEVAKEILKKPRGLLLITGATGSGKSTTLASMVQFLNENNRIHIVTLENPIEFVYKDRKATITQREMGSDCPNLSEALKSALRQDPDVIVISEMRDFETIQTAFTAAETGHLVISTLHTNDAKSAIERMVEVFPSDQQNQVRIQLATSLLAVFSQTLVNKKEGTGRILASEVMIKSPSIEHCLKRGDFDQINHLIETSDTYYHMQALNQELESLVKTGQITLEEALSHSQNADDLRLRFSGVDRKEGYELYESYKSSQNSSSLNSCETGAETERFPTLQEITLTKTKIK